MQQEPDLKEIMMANKTKIKVISEGDIDIPTVVGEVKHDIKIRKAMHVADLTTNLLSVRKTTNFCSSTCSI